MDGISAIYPDNLNCFDEDVSASNTIDTQILG